MSETQYQLFERTKQQRFNSWIDTEFGVWVSRKFIELAIRCLIKNRKQTGRGIWEDVREIYLNREFDKRNPGPGVDCTYAMNDHLYPYLVSYAIEHYPKLGAFLKVKQRNTKKKTRAVVVPIK